VRARPRAGRGVTEATSLVYLAELLFEFGDLLAQVPLERLIVNQQQELPILHDLHFQFYALVLLTHDSIPDVFFIETSESQFCSAVIILAPEARARKAIR
jgi:hypothetical protein